VRWVVQTNLFREAGHERLCDALERLGVPYTLVQLRHFTDALFKPGTEEEVELPAGRAWVMGSYKLVRIAQGRGLKPGAFHGGLDARATRDLWGTDWLQWGCAFAFLRDVPPLTEPRFIRPTYDSKTFAGRVFFPDEFAAFQEEACKRTGEDDRAHGGIEVLVARPRLIYSETRFWVVRGEVITSSLYKRGGQPHFQEGAPSQAVEDFARACARAAWTTYRGANPAYVLDVAETPNGPKVIETNCLNSAGFYAADMQALVAAIEEKIA
jgi:hypothetical protein